MLLAFSEGASEHSATASGFLIEPGRERPVAALTFARETLDVLALTDLDGRPVTSGFDGLELGELSFSSEVHEQDEQRLLSDTSLDEVRESVDAVVQALMFIVPALVLALGVMTWFAVGQALRPVHAISERVAAISSSTLDERVPVPAAQDEIAEMAMLMNQMLDRLEDGAARQRYFVADASHELRSPLSTIKAAAEVAQASDDPARFRELADEVAAEATRMEALIADLLALARLDEGADHPIQETVDISERCMSAVEQLPSSPISVEVIRADGVVVEGVAQQLERAIFNLLLNATQHARSRVRLESRLLRSRAQVIVDDDGAGVDASERERIFERFVRADRSRQRLTGGTGIGLSLVRIIAERHGGKVIVGDAPELGGARFILEIEAAST